MSLNSNLNWNLGRRAGGGYPVAGLLARYTQSADGEDLVDQTGNSVDIPYVSGSGLDQIFNFGVLSGDHWDKGSYIGNGLGLPEIYDFPYIGIYYDPTSATTRKYWKLTDFAYAVILNQTLDTDYQNIYFLKALATTNTSNVIDTIQELLIYLVKQIDPQLSQLKNYIGIQNDFYSDNLVINGDFEIDTNVDGLADGWNSITAAATTIITGSGHPTKAQRLVASASAGVFLIQAENILKAGCTYDIELYTRSNYNTSSGTGAYTMAIPANTGDAKYFTKRVTPTVTSSIRIYSINAAHDEWLEASNVTAKQFFQNYYKS